MKAVLLSIQPKWCELIANGQKTIEVRKTRPKLETPFKCYIYCTNGQMLFNGKKYIPDWEDKLVLAHPSNTTNVISSSVPFINRKVIGEFMCDRIIDIKTYEETDRTIQSYTCDLYDTEDLYMLSCLTDDEICKYLDCKNGYGWHISDLKIYDNPKELREFGKAKPKFTSGDDCSHCIYHEYTHDTNGLPNGEICHSKLEEPLCDYTPSLTRPPQSWCYVEELGVVEYD